jgi:hypothetical protein
MSTSSSVVAVARDFFCEHAAAKSRVLVLLSRAGCHDSIQAVLTCADADLAQQVAVLLRNVVEGGRGPAVQAEAERLAGLLPAAVAASLRQAVDWLFTGAWPVADHAHRDLPTPEHDDEHPHPGIVDLLSRTPAEARLADLPGTVVRVFRMVEFHVHDAQRLRAAAIATGWPPTDSDELSDDDPHDVLGAAMCLTDDMPTLPGADVIGVQSMGEVLRAQREEDELADWSTTPVVVDFGAGYRTSRRPDDGPESLPDFAALFPAVDDDHAWHLTPRTASVLYTALCTLADEAYDDVEEHADQPVPGPDAGDWSVLPRLPRITWRQDTAWRRDLARAADDLATDLEHGQWPNPRCTAEEMLLHLAIQDAEAIADDDIDDEGRQELPEYDGDYDWDLCSEMLFQDHDVLLLEEGWADGVEDPDSQLNQKFRIGDLRPANWFQPFNNVEARPATRGHRR